MFKRLKKIKEKKTVTFATSCWEKDWQIILKKKNYLSNKMIKNHLFSFDEKILIINNIENNENAVACARKLVNKKILSKFYIAKENEEKILSSFELERDDFANKWVYYNALAPLSAIYYCRSDYLLYVTGDSYMEKPTEWIQKAIDRMEKKEEYKVANPTWNEKYMEAKKEAYKKEKDFFVAKEGFSDQCFLVKTKYFQKPIYKEIREDASHFPRGDVFEKRVYSFMKNHGWKRITYRHGSYTHENLY